MPKIGPFKAVDFKIPTQKTEDLYITSVDHTVEDYTKLLHEVGAGNLKLANTDFDTGRVTHVGEYELSDKAYAHLLDQLAEHNFEQVTPDVRADILAFFSNFNAPPATKKKRAKKKPDSWQKTLDELERLKSLPATEKTSETHAGNADAVPEIGSSEDAAPVGGPLPASAGSSDVRQ